MIMSRSLASGLVALGLSLGLSGTVIAAPAQRHDGHGGSAIELQLNNGQKWQTDEALRTGMGRIRGAIDSALPQIHAGRFSAAAPLQ